MAYKGASSEQLMVKYIASEILPDESGGKTNSETNLDDKGQESVRISQFSYTAPSSYASDYSSDDLFQVHPHLVLKSDPSNKVPNPSGETKQLYENKHLDISSEALCRLEESFTGSPDCTPRFSNITHEARLSPTQSPSVQVMERSLHYDPDRIPASVFNKSSTPIDWSVASTESLFSIHIGNTFSREHAIKMGNDLHGSGELLKPGEESRELWQSEELEKSRELYQFEGLHKSGELKTSDDLLRGKKTLSALKGAETSIDKPVIGVNKLDTNLGQTKDFAIVNHQSDESENVIHSPGFPKWLGCTGRSCKGFTCPSCSCSFCSWPSCCCKSANCCSIQPSCGCKLDWLSCDCPTWSSCCCKCPWR